MKLFKTKTSGMQMTAADIIMIFIGIIGLLFAFGSFVIALLAFLDRDKEHKLFYLLHSYISAFL